MRDAKQISVALLPGLPADLIEAAYAKAPGEELDSGKFFSPESSAALVANAFGFFLNRAGDLPPLPGCDINGWSATSVMLEAIVRFPWAGGRHPCLDVLVQSGTSIIGIESKRYEPFRLKQRPDLSDAYWRPVWGEAMAGYEQVRDQLRDGSLQFLHLDGCQLIKHAFGLRTEGKRLGKKPVLCYLYAEPPRWPDGRAISESAKEIHRTEIARFATLVSNCEVSFLACTYAALLARWKAGGSEVRAHAAAVFSKFIL